MWAKALQLLAKTIIIPMLTDIAKALYFYFKSKIDQKKQAEDNQKKADEYANAQDKKASGDTFTNLP